MRLTWLAEVLRDEGLKVIEVAGWESRGAEGWSLDAMNPAGVICHATAGATNGSTTGELNIIRDGREGLAGPIAQLYLARDSTFYVVAAGVANHAGSGGLWGVSGNNRVVGIEAGNDNKGEPWRQYDAYVAGVAAILRKLDLPASRAGAHREWSTTGKTDPVGIDMTEFRAQVGARLAGGDIVISDDDAKKIAKAVLSTHFEAVPGYQWMSLDSGTAEIYARSGGRGQITATLAELRELRAIVDALALAQGVDLDELVRRVRETIDASLRDDHLRAAGSESPA